MLNFKICYLTNLTAMFHILPRREYILNIKICYLTNLTAMVHPLPRRKYILNIKNPNTASRIFDII